MQISIFVVSNVRLHRDGLVALLRACPSIEVVGTDSVQDALNAVRPMTADVALIDALYQPPSKRVDTTPTWRKG